MESSAARESKPPASVSHSGHQMSLTSWVKVVEYKLFNLYPESPPWLRRLQAAGGVLTAYGVFNECVSQTVNYMPYAAAAALGVGGALLVFDGYTNGIGIFVRNNYGVVGPRFNKQYLQLGKLEQDCQLLEEKIINYERSSARSPQEKTENQDIVSVNLSVQINEDTESCPTTYWHKSKNFFLQHFWFTPGISVPKKIQEGFGTIFNGLIGYIGFSHLPYMFLSDSPSVRIISKITGIGGGFASAFATKSVLGKTFKYQSLPDAQQELEDRLKSLNEKCQRIAKKLCQLRGIAPEEAKVLNIEMSSIPIVTEYSGGCTKAIMQRLENMGRRSLDEIENHIYPDVSWQKALVLKAGTILCGYLNYSIPFNYLNEQGGNADAARVVAVLSGLNTLAYTNTVCEYNIKYANSAQAIGGKIAEVMQALELLNKHIDEFIAPSLLVKQPSVVASASVVSSVVEDEPEVSRLSCCSRIGAWGIFGGFRSSMSTLRRMVNGSQAETVAANNLELAFVPPAVQRVSRS